MIATGWRPRLLDVVAWILPLADPTGSEALPGLWIPLWYIRAYIWFVILSGLLKRLENRWSLWAVMGSSAAAVAMWGYMYSGHSLPLAVSDAFGYLPFVIAGMAYRRRGYVGGAKALKYLALTAGGLAVVSWRLFGPADGVVNRSYLLMLLVGTAGIAAAVGFRPAILGALDESRLADRVVERINSRALTVYLWQGFGLVAADRLVAGRVDNRVAWALLSIVIVGAVVVVAAFVFGPVEDFAARRVRFGELWSVHGPRTTPLTARSSRFALGSGLLVVVVVSLWLPVASGHSTNAPLSGNAVVARAGLVERDLHTGTESEKSVDKGATPQEVLTKWLNTSREELSVLDLKRVDVLLAEPDGSIREAHWGEHSDEPLFGGR